MKLYVNRNFVGERAWGGGAKFSDQVITHYADQLVTDIRDADVALAVGINGEDGTLSADDIAQFKHSHNPKLRFVLRVNDCDKRKSTSDVDKRIAFAASEAEHVVFVSNWMRTYFMFESKHAFVHKQHPNASVIVNGCDKSVFCDRVSKHLKLHNDGRTHVVYTSWSDNNLKGRDGIEFMDDFQRRHCDTHTFTFIGRTKAKLERATHVQPLCGKPLANVMCLHDVYVFFSKWDPAPNACIEAISCGLSTYVRSDSGGAIELAGQDHVFLDFNDLEKLLLSRNFAPNHTKVKTWAECVLEYDKVLRP